MCKMVFVLFCLYLPRDHFAYSLTTTNAFEFDNLLLDFVPAAEDWLNPSAVLEAFEARAARISVSCAKNLLKFDSQEQGTCNISVRQ